MVGRAGPCAGLVLNACVWGLAWWPLRWLEGHGVHPIWATTGFFLVGLVLIGLARPRAWRVLAAHPRLWVLALAAGATNAAFNWGVTAGDVVRVVLLFYLMPLWAVLLARWLLHEPVTRPALARIALALGGAVLVLQPADGPAGWPTFSGLADWLGLLGGLGFALTNVLLREQNHQPSSVRALAMFCGGLLLPALLGLALLWLGQIGPLPAWNMAWGLGVAGMGLVFLASNVALQYGAARLPVRIASVVMLTEVLFAALSAVLIGQEVLTGRMLAGAGLILASALLASMDEARAPGA